jgi:hypothetical protein
MFRQNKRGLPGFSSLGVLLGDSEQILALDRAPISADSTRSKTGESG